MNDWDKSREVWQRVTNPQPPVMKEGLRALRRESWALCGAYRFLMATLKGKAVELAGQLYREETETANILRGLEVLRGEDGGRMTNGSVKEPPLRLLRSCYHRTRTAMAEYTARTVDPETGGVFRELADKAQRQCALLAELMGVL